MIRNIVFDISNVLAPFRFKEFLVEKGFDGTMIKKDYQGFSHDTILDRI